tara:strand:+ start:1037 stop:1600 length:564 start_codon:yes stop_codon:yes gene_type:complete
MLQIMFLGEQDFYPDWKFYTVIFIAYSIFMSFLFEFDTNCIGCFNPVQGICLLNPDDTCAPFTKAQCLTKGSPWIWSNTSLNSWPKGCLSTIEAVGFGCAGLLPLCPETNAYLPHANSVELCEKSAIKSGAKIIGFNALSVGDPNADNCFALYEFGGGCVWQEWTYYAFNKNIGWLQKKICGMTKDG